MAKTMDYVSTRVFDGKRPIPKERVDAMRAHYLLHHGPIFPNPKEPDTMSNETQTTETTADERTADLTAMMQAAAAAQDGSPKTILPVIGPITDDGVIVVSDAPYDANTTYVRAADDVPPIGPIPADDLLFSMNETQAVYLYTAHGLSGAHSHDEMIEMLQAKRDAAPAQPETIIEHAEYLADRFGISTASLAGAVFGGAETPASEPAPEREKVWNIHLQAWV